MYYSIYDNQTGRIKSFAIKTRKAKIRLEHH